MDEKTPELKPEKKGISKPLLFGGIFLLLLILGGVFFFATRILGGGSDEPKTVLGPIYESKEYTVNILEAGGRRFLRTKFSVEVSDKKVVTEIGTKLPIFNDVVNQVLGSQTLSDLESPAAKDRVRAQLIDALNRVLDDGEVTNIYFDVFVWQ